MIRDSDLNNRAASPDEERGAQLSPSQLAEDWGVDVRTVRRDILKGALPAFRLPNGRWAVARSDADRYGTPVVAVPVEAVEQTWRQIELAAAFDRAGGMCQLCREPVDRTIRSGAMQATLDHIYPQVLGGDHDRTNLQLAHRLCNSRKGARVLTGGGVQHDRAL